MESLFHLPAAPHLGVAVVGAVGDNGWGLVSRTCRRMRPAHAAAASCAVVPPFKEPLIETGGDVREEAQGEGEGEETGVKERWAATRGAATSFGAFNERPFIVPRSSFKLFRGTG